MTDYFVANGSNGADAGANETAPAVNGGDELGMDEISVRHLYDWRQIVSN